MPCKLQNTYLKKGCYDLKYRNADNADLGGFKRIINFNFPLYKV